MAADPGRQEEQDRGEPLLPLPRALPERTRLQHQRAEDRLHGARRSDIGEGGNRVARRTDMGEDANRGADFDDGIFGIIWA